MEAVRFFHELEPAGISNPATTEGVLGDIQITCYAIVIPSHDDIAIDR